MRYDAILDVGCGTGSVIKHFFELGKEAYGIDLPLAHSAWAEDKLPRKNFFSCDAALLPFKDNSFDVVYSLGVIEHIGMQNDFATPLEDFWTHRTKFAEELLRVTRKGGCLIISCPNKSFPIDVQHGPVTPPLLSIRRYILKKSRLHLHPIWGVNHLLSYKETEQLFLKAGASAATLLSLEGYFSYTVTSGGIGKLIKPLLIFYVEKLVPFMPKFLNPYVLVKIDK